MRKTRFVRATALAMSLSLASLTAAAAQQADHGMHGVQSQSGQAYMGAMETMMEGMVSMEMTGDPGVDFAMMMIPHHQSAIDMAEAYLADGDDPELTELANQIISEQRREIEVLENWLEQNR